MESPAPNPVIPKLQLASLRDAVKGLTRQDVDLQAREEEANRAAIENDGRREYFRLRGSWSVYLGGFLGSSLLFQFIIAIGVGWGFLRFDNYHDVLKWIVATNFGQILGMGYIVVRHLFPSKK